MYLLAETGLTFQRDKQAEGWEVVRDSATLATGNRIRTNDQGSARLVIGSNVQILCGANSLLQITQYLDDQGRHVTQLASQGGNLKVRASGREETDAREDRAEAAAPRRFGDRIEIVYEDRHIIADAQKLELDFQHDREGNRVIAAVYAGGVQVKHDRTGDEVAIGAGREAVMLPAGIAVRPAAAKPDSWWPARRSQTATGTGGGFSR